MSILRKLSRALGFSRPQEGSSSGYEIIDQAAALASSHDGWLDPSVAGRQDAAFGRLLDGMRAGNVRRDFEVAAEAVRGTGLDNPSLLEVGCGSGYYSDVFAHLLGGKLRYTGLDYSEAMITLARARYPDAAFVVGDATALPFEDGAFDIVMNGVSLMHIVEYGKAIAESRRVARRWAIFHTVPVLQRRETTFLRKKAYGLPTVEVIFNESELVRLFETSGLQVRQSYSSLPYDLSFLLGEPTLTRTYLCEIVTPCAT